jgi:hypothetical protein
MLVAGMISARDITWVTPPVLNIQNGCAHESKLHTQALVTNIDFAILIFRNQYVWQEPVLYGYLLHWFILYLLIIWNSWNRKKDRNAFHHFGSVRFRDYGPVLSVYRVPVYSPTPQPRKTLSIHSFIHINSLEAQWHHVDRWCHVAEDNFKIRRRNFPLF